MITGLREQDRGFLLRSCELVEGAKRPPLKLGLRPEPTWSALLASEDRELASAVFSPGDSTDAVARLMQSFESSALDLSGATLFLTLEPKASFDRLPPFTESIRRLGVKRVVIGTLDPALRYRGEGSRTLERMGVDVVLADGEEARRCQHLLEDYAKWLQRGLAVLRARVELSSVPGGEIDVKFSEESHPYLQADAVICRPGGKVPSGDAWKVVLDQEGWARPQEKTIIYQTRGALQATGAREIPMRDGSPDLGAILRDLASLGLLSVELCSDTELFRLAIRSGLLDSVVAHFPETGDTLRVLSRAQRVRLSQGNDSLELRLDSARLLDGHNSFLEARVELC